VFHDEPLSQPGRTPLTREAFVGYTTRKLSINRERLHWLTRHVSGFRGRAVDIGTKDGSAVKVLADGGWQAIGYDPDQRFHAFARQMYGVEIRPEWFTAEAVGPGTLDVVTAFHVLEHIPQPLPWLSAIHEALQAQGWLYVETPNLRHIQARQLARGHVVLYTAHTLRQVLEKAGFTIVAITEYAPGGLRTYDQVAAVAQRGHPKPIQLGLGRVDRSVPRYVARAKPDPPPSLLLPVRVYRGVKRRVRAYIRRASYRALR
jgi:SAM-dependent methyltransferase